MKITVLGSGGSLGVPMVGNLWGTVDRTNPKNRRRRPSIMIAMDETQILIDTGPDLREQLLDAAVDRLDAVFFTHAHADHVAGLDDLRALTWVEGKPIQAFAAEETAKEISSRFAYAVAGVDYDRGSYAPIIDLDIIPAGVTEVAVGNGKSVTAFTQIHGTGTSVGFRAGDFAYSTDVSDLDDAAWNALDGVKVWMLDATREEPHPSHAHLARTLEWIERLGPDRAILTHMNHTMDYERLLQNLPKGVEPAFDGMVVDMNEAKPA